MGCDLGSRLEIVNPLTKTARETFKTAADWGFLTDLERTAFTERAAWRLRTATVREPVPSLAPELRLRTARFCCARAASLFGFPPHVLSTILPTR
jgi:hypothetical protein